MKHVIITVDMNRTTKGKVFKCVKADLIAASLTNAAEVIALL